MIEILLQPGEISSHAHTTESYSTLVEGRANIEYGNIIQEMITGQAYLIPQHTRHTMTNIGDRPVKIRCEGH